MRRASALLLAALSVAGCRGWTSESPPVHLNPNMDTQEKLKPYRDSDFFADGRAMRPIPEGTVARGSRHVRDGFADHQDDHFTLGTVGGAPATALPSSLAVDERTIQRGHERYDIYCAPCHDRTGTGQGTVAARLAIKPPSFHDDRIKTMPIGKIYQAITLGVNPPNMPSYATQIPVDDRWAIAVYLRALQKAKDPAFDPTKVGAAAAAPATPPAAPAPATPPAAPAPQTP
jgi:mono/diheme cytochrome c family protein